MIRSAGKPRSVVASRSNVEADIERKGSSISERRSVSSHSGPRLGAVLGGGGEAFKAEVRAGKGLCPGIREGAITEEDHEGTRARIGLIGVCGEHGRGEFERRSEVSGLVG